VKPSTQLLLDEGVNILIVVALAVAVLFSGLAGDTVPLDASSIYSHWPWEEARPAGLIPTEDPVARIEAETIYLAYAFLAEAPSGKDGLLWNSIEGFGYPFFASWESRCLSPFSLPFYLFGPARALALSALLKMLVAGLAAYYVARKLGFHGPFALLVAVAFELCGHFMLLPAHPVSDVMPWTPLLFLFIERLALGQGEYWPAGAGIGALMLLGGDGAAVAVIWAYGLCYLLARFTMMERATSRRSILLYYAAAAGSSLGLAALQLAPYIEWYRLSVSNILNAVHAAGFREFFGIFSPGFISAGEGGSLVSPRTSGLVHMGFVQLLLIVLWCALRHCVEGPHRQRMDALLSVSTAFYVFALAAGPLIERSTTLQIGTQHLLAANAFAFALGGAAAAESWLELTPEQCTSSLKRFAAALLGVGAVGALAAVIVLRTANPEHGSIVPHAALLLAIVVVFAGMVAATLLKPSPRLMAYGMAALTAVDLLAAFLPLTARTNVDYLYPSTPTIESLAGSSMRIATAGGQEAWPLGGNFVPHLPGTRSRVLRQTAAYMDRANDDPFLLQTAGGVGLVLETGDIRRQDGHGGQWAKARSGLRLKHAFPSGRGLFQTVSRPGQAWLEPITPPLAAPKQQLANPSTEKQSNGRLVIRTQSSEPSRLVVAQAHYPGWKARSGKETLTVSPKDDVFRSVELPAGEHAVEFHFDPFSLRVGVWISAASGLAVLIGMARLCLSAARARGNRL
jgi:hypothetical protein